MKVLRWWFGIRCFGCAIYVWPRLQRNPAFCFSVAGKQIVAGFGSRTIWLRRGN